MENAAIIGLSRQIVLGRALDVAANNIANQSTAGFKAESLRFETYLVDATTPGASRGPHTRDFALVHDPNSRTDFSAGSLIQTGATLDFAITGDGFFAVETPAGQQYTRDGHFSLSAFGELTTRDGYPVLDDSGAPILIDPLRGPLTVSPEGELQQESQLIARLGVYQFADNQSLSRTGQNLFASTDEPVALVPARVEQGFIEGANVSPIEGLTQMIKISRAYAAAAQLIETSNELSREAIQSFTDTV